MKVFILVSSFLVCALSRPQGYSEEPAYPDEPAKYTHTMKVFILVSSFLVCALARPQGYSEEPAYPDEPAKYTYTYGVQDPETANNYGQQESRDGYSTQGEYFVNLPDGRLQKVTYTVSGDGGYIAEVTYTGEAQYPPEPAGGYKGRK